MLGLSRNLPPISYYSACAFRGPACLLNGIALGRRRDKSDALLPLKESVLFGTLCNCHIMFVVPFASSEWLKAGQREQQSASAM